MTNYTPSDADPGFVRQRVREMDPANNSKYNAMDDIASSLIFAAIYRDCLRYNGTSKSWYVYDGVKWKPDNDDLTVERYAKILARELWIYSADVGNKQFRGYIDKLQERKRRRTMIDDARDLLPVCQADFDRDPYLFNCQNGILDLRDLSFREHDPGLLLSKAANVAYDPDAACGAFDAFMDQITEGDRAKAAYLQTMFGYAMTGKNEREECVMLYGATTRNGKGTLTNTIKHLFGDYGATIQPESLAMQKNRDGRTASGDIARLNGVRFLQMSEPPKRMKLDVALLKTLTGRDSVTARRLYEREFEFIPCFKLFINTNFLPVVLDDTLFSSGRVKVVTFNRHFEESEQDHTLKDRLQSPEELSGILNWMLAGLKRYQAAGNSVTIPDSVKSATEEYCSKSDKMKNFIEDVLTKNDRATVRVKDVYIAYGKWCRINGYGVENKQNFIAELKAKGLYSSTGTINGITYHNVVRGYQIDDEMIGTD